MDGLRILIVDDHPVFRAGARSVFEMAPGLEVVGEASSGAEAVALAADLQPDVVVMDIRMPEVSGIDATRRIIDASPHIGVLVLTMLEDEASVFAALQAGARGYLLKEAPASELIRAVEAVANRETILGAGVAARVSDFFTRRHVPAPEDPFPQLTARERDVLQLLAVGHNSPRIAQKLALSPKTVRNHVSNILSKLHAADRTEAVIRARNAGLGSSSGS